MVSAITMFDPPPLDDAREPLFQISFTSAGGRESDEAPAEIEGDDTGPDAREALAAFARAARIDPNEPDYHFILGEALLAAGRVGEAVLSLREAVALHPRGATYDLALGRALTARHRFADAIESLRSSTELAPADPDGWSALGAALLAAAQPQDALRALDEARKLAPRRADVLGNRGIALWFRGQSHEALLAFESACDAAPGAAVPQRNLGLALIELGHVQKALDVLEEARTLHPGSSSILIDMGDALFRLGRREDAEASYRAALEISPTCLERRPGSQQRFLTLSTATMTRELGLRRPASVMALAGILGFLDSAGALRFGRPLGQLVAVTAAAVLILGIWRVTPPYVHYLLLRDDVEAIAMTPIDDDGFLMERLRKAVERRHLASQIDAATACTIRTRPRWRTVECDYSVPVEILPGWASRIPFHILVERSFIDVGAYEVPVPRQP
jgi:Flp pilus assembly protein TadD